MSFDDIALLFSQIILSKKFYNFNCDLKPPVIH